ncbi:MAG: PaaX family transcriptional regulator C-terminal domain-containing protein [Actinomycetota bacterium]
MTVQPRTGPAPRPAAGLPPGAATPRLSRRHAAGAPSARGLLFTVLGEFALTSGTVWTSAMIAAFGRLGVEEKTTRQALMRTAAAGWLRAEKAGRRTRWHLTDAARRLLTDGAERIYSFTGPAGDWDGRWLIIAARIPDSDRSARHMVRSRLSWAGFGSMGPGLWISTHPEREAEVAQVLRDAGIAGDAHVFVATRTGLADVRSMVSAAWDLAAIEQEYEQFIADFSGGQRDDPLTRQVELVHAWRRFPAIDPALPSELLPARWSGRAAARLFTGLHEQWASAAQLAWEQLNQG